MPSLVKNRDELGLFSFFDPYIKVFHMYFDKLVSVVIGSQDSYLASIALDSFEHAFSQIDKNLFESNLITNYLFWKKGGF